MTIVYLFFFVIGRVLTRLTKKNKYTVVALDKSCEVSFVDFALDLPEREKREGSTTPCGVEDVVGPGSHAQPGWLGGVNRMSNTSRTTTHARNLSMVRIGARTNVLLAKNRQPGFRAGPGDSYDAA